MLKSEQKKNTTSKIVYVGLRIIMALMLVVCIIGICIDKDESMQSRYFFHATQCLFFLIVSFIPKMIKKIKVEIPEYAMVVFILFCFAHFFFGEIVNFYAKIKWWDSALHTFSGGMLALLSFSLVYLLNNSDQENLKLSPLFVSIFAFCFTVVIGVIWEFVEWISDEISDGNMQRWANSITGQPFVGREALKDTMKDLMLDMIGASAVCLVCGIIMQYGGDFKNRLIVLKKSAKTKSEDLEGLQAQIEEKVFIESAEEDVSKCDKNGTNDSELVDNLEEKTK